jgi:hypothetical protein
VKTRFLLAALLVIDGGAVFAQEARPSVLAIDTVAAVEEVADDSGNFVGNLTFDAVVSAELGRGFEALVRPIAQRRNGEWNRQIWLAAIRYGRQGTVALRVDAGLITPPVGLANLTLRPHENPTISQPSSLFSSLPAVEYRGPRTTLMGAAYPFGAQVTVSGLRWDARAAVIDTSPLRPREVFAETNPPRFANVVIGGGITPVVGVRAGASATRGKWRRASELPLGTADRSATLVTVEVELAFRYTELSAEWVRDALETEQGTQVASGWFVQGQQTLTPRWFAAGRVERISTLAALPEGFAERRLSGVEATLGYRLTPEITVRIGHRARRGFGRPGYSQQGAVSIVWWRRWM